MAKFDKKRFVKHQYVQHSDEYWRITFTAVVTEGYDWSCYVSASFDASAHRYDKQIEGNLIINGVMTEEQAMNTAAEYGNKLNEATAKGLFPFIHERYSE